MRCHTSYYSTGQSVAEAGFFNYTTYRRSSQREAGYFNYTTHRRASQRENVVCMRDATQAITRLTKRR
jgi:hypothetical protein